VGLQECLILGHPSVLEDTGMIWGHQIFCRRSNTVVQQRMCVFVCGLGVYIGKKPIESCSLAVVAYLGEKCPQKFNRWF
jgi:hypothetical protein